ncbi:MAG: FeoB-associated Cys-rich membrane protein [Lachnospiraceae bacterium]|jgi:hypothetical protein|nr:FeoB-associated Cys-rich membrane protein [Lachnospiraceae bacterium]
MADLVILVGVAGAVAVILWKKARDVKAGKSGCSCGCSGCPGRGKDGHCRG